MCWKHLKKPYCVPKKVVLWVNWDRWLNNSTTAANETDKNLTHTTKVFQNQLKDVYVYRVPLNFLCHLSWVNQRFKFITKFTLALETEIQKLLGTNAVATSLPRSVDAEIIFDSAPYIQYEQIKIKQ